MSVSFTHKLFLCHKKLKLILCFISSICFLCFTISTYDKTMNDVLQKRTMMIYKDNGSINKHRYSQTAKEFMLNFGNKTIRYNTLEWLTPSTFNVVYASEATILFPSGLVFNWSHTFHFGKWYWTNVKKTNQIKQIYHDDFVFTFIQIWNNFFQHIVFDTLPKARFVCKWLQINKWINILVYNTLQRELIQVVCSLPNRRFKNLNSNAQFKGIYLSFFGNSVYKMGIVPPGCLQSLGSHNIAGYDVLYLPRTKGKPRSVRNEHNVLVLLRKFWPNLKIVNLTNNWKQDRKHFSSARVIIGPHGGGMSNMIFAPINTTVVEFLPIERLKLTGKNERPCYLGLAMGLGFKYFAVEPEIFSFDSEMSVSLKQLEFVVKRIQ